LYAQYRSVEQYNAGFEALLQDQEAGQLQTGKAADQGGKDNGTLKGQLQIVERMELIL